MNCHRCRGLLVKDYMLAIAEYDRMKPCWKCVNCGFRDDLIYRMNRLSQGQGVSHG